MRNVAGLVFPLLAATRPWRPLRRERWRFSTGRTISATPAVAGGLVFVTSRDNVLWAVDAATGRQLWRVDHQMSWNTSPPVDEGAVDAGSSDTHFLRALDAGTGRQLWRLDTDGAVWSSPAIGVGWST